MMETLIVFMLFWFGCGLLSAGLMRGYCVHNWPFFRSGAWEITMPLLGGPLGLIVSICMYWPYRFRLRPVDKEEAWVAHYEKWPALTREHFDHYWENGL